MQLKKKIVTKLLEKERCRNICISRTSLLCSSIEMLYEEEWNESSTFQSNSGMVSFCFIDHFTTIVVVVVIFVVVDICHG